MDFSTVCSMNDAAYRENYKLIDWTVKAPPAPPRERLEAQRSDLPAPIVMKDYFVPGKSQIDGKFYDNGPAYRQHVRETGHEIVGDQVHHVMAENAAPAVADEVAIERTIRKAVRQHVG